jgi:hypothetical protein
LPTMLFSDSILEFRSGPGKSQSDSSSCIRNSDSVSSLWELIMRLIPNMVELLCDKQLVLWFRNQHWTEVRGSLVQCYHLQHCLRLISCRYYYAERCSCLD